MDGILFIGLSMNLPGAQTQQQQIEDSAKIRYAVLGFAANDGNIPGAFRGDFVLQDALYDEMVSILFAFFTLK